MSKKTKYPTTIRAYATIKFKEPIPEDTGRVCTWESFMLNVDGKVENIDFEDKEICVDKEDRSVVEVMWRNPDWEDFSKGFKLLTFEALSSGNITLEGSLDTAVCASKNGYPLDDDAEVIEIDHIINMALVSPYNEFKDVILVNDKNGGANE